MNNLNPHSKLASFYRYFYMTENLPNNLCAYFWGLMVAFLFTPFVWIQMAINRYRKAIRLKSRETSDVSYDEKGNYRPINIKTMLYYDKSYNTLSTGYGIIYTFGVFVLGLIFLCHLEKFNIIILDFKGLNHYLIFSSVYLFGLIFIVILGIIGFFIFKCHQITYEIIVRNKKKINS